MTTPPSPGPSDSAALAKFAAGVERFARFVTRHWAGLISTIILVYVGLPFAAPVLMHVGLTTPARALYVLYFPFCHQLPERSYFLFGEAPVYGLQQLQADGVAEGNILARRSYVGDEQHGYKVALCERDLAIWGAMLLTALFFMLRQRRIQPLPLKFFALFLIPIAVDGFTQLFGLRESNWWLRTITGGLMGMAMIWVAFPMLAEAMAGENG